MNNKFKTAQSGVATARQLEQINRFSLKALGEDEVYTFAVVLCDNEIDRDFERFDTDALKTLSELFLGKTGIFDHSMSGRDQTTRIFDTQLIVDNERKNSVGEPYAYIRAMAYMPKTDKNACLIAEIDAGIKKEASVGCAVGSIVCSLCGTEQKSGMCEHVKGKSYSGNVCHHILRCPTDAYEWSFVAVPAQRAAGVTKAFCCKEDKEMDDIIKAVKQESGDITLSAQELDRLKQAIGGLEARALDAQGYREQLTQETVRVGLLALKSIDGEKLTSICSRLASDELCELKKAFTASAEKNIPLEVQLKAEQTSQAENDEFRI